MSRKQKMYLLLLILYSFSTIKISAQHKLPFKLSKEQAELLKGQQNEDKNYIISGDSLYYESPDGSIIESVVLYNPALKKKLLFSDCKYIFNFAIDIDSCYFKDSVNFPISPECNNDYLTMNFRRGFIISKSHFTWDISIRNIKHTTKTGAVRIEDNFSKYIDIESNDFNYLNLVGNTLEDNLTLAYDKFNLGVISRNKFSKIESILKIFDCKFEAGLSVLDNTAKETEIEKDTIKGLFIISIPNSLNSLNSEAKRKTIKITNCYVNAQCNFSSEDSACHSLFMFDNCSFGNSASLFNLNIDTLVFKNCSDIPYPLFLTADSSRKGIYIQLINSNVNNIRFDYTDKFKLYFDSSISEETKNNTYQSLFAKYKSEGKPKNIEKIDIEYKRYEYKKSWWTYPIWLLDYIWWRYGYSKWLIIVWTLVFMGVFLWFNYIHWEGMRKMYSVFDKADLSLLGHIDNAGKVRKKIIYVLLFTSFIFFSLRVDFDKLKYANNKYLVSFFTQYIIGLICLFFLANAIFKLG
jgi:hypothetical protein